MPVLRARIAIGPPPNLIPHEGVAKSMPAAADVKP
jgi:hypothetical protein